MDNPSIDELEFEGITNDEFKVLMRELVREEIKSLLSGELKDILKPKKEYIDEKKKKKIERVRDYWNEVATKPNRQLFHNSKLNILQAIDDYGIRKVFDSIDIVWNSPLMKGNNVYKKHLQSLDWCTKPDNLVKIFDGMYSKDKKGFQNKEFNESKEEWD